jgi:cytidylate kinase
MAKIIHKIIEEQIRKWEHKSPDKKKIVTPKGQPYPVITISREFGARGGALASLMGEKLGFKVWDKDILQAIADNLGSNQELLKSLDENRRKLIEDAVVGFMTKVNTNVNYHRSLNRVIKTIEHHGNAIIVGRGANYICQNLHAFNLRIVSPIDKRVTDYAAREGISKEEAYSMIRKIDAERTEFIRFYFKKDVANPSDYDLVLNSGIFSLHDMMAIIIDAYEHKSGLKLSIFD